MNPPQPPLLIEADAAGVARVTLNRPEVHNAFDDRLIAELADAFERLAVDERIRAVVLTARGRSFSAGADLEWMRRVGEYPFERNLADAMKLGDMLRAIEICPKPIIAVVQGAAYGGGVGLVAACDIALAAESATFALSEVRLGLIPAVIGPYVAAAIGERACRRYFLTAERFSAAEAHRLGLVHEVVPADRLASATDEMIAALLQGSPAAQASAKELTREMAGRSKDDGGLLAETAATIARLRASAEGREGLAAFLEKRKPQWMR